MFLPIFVALRLGGQRADQDGTRSAAQIRVFEDTWRWDQSSATAYEQVVEAGGKVSEVMQAFRLFLGENDVLAYLSMMAPRRSRPCEPTARPQTLRLGTTQRYFRRAD